MIRHRGNRRCSLEARFYNRRCQGLSPWVESKRDDIQERARNNLPHAYSKCSSATAPACCRTSMITRGDAMCFRPPSIDNGPVKCPQCGAEVEANASECSNCGAKAVAAPGVAAPGAPAPPPIPGVPGAPKVPKAPSVSSAPKPPTP